MLKLYGEGRWVVNESTRYSQCFGLLLDSFLFPITDSGHAVWTSQVTCATTGADGLNETNFPNAKLGTPITLHPRTLTRYSFYSNHHKKVYFIIFFYLEYDWNSFYTFTHWISPQNFVSNFCTISNNQGKTKLIGLWPNGCYYLSGGEKLALRCAFLNRAPSFLQN